MLLKKKSHSIVYSFLLLPSFTLANTQATPAIPYYFVADSVVYLSKAHKIIYTGHVKIDQGQTHITGDQLILNLTTDNKITQMVDTGRPATYTTVLAGHPGVLYARANRITYQQQQQIVYLDGNAFVDQNHNTIRAEHIRYDKQDGIVHTHGSPQNSSTYIVVQPNTTQKKAKIS